MKVENLERFKEVLEDGVEAIVVGVMHLVDVEVVVVVDEVAVWKEEERRRIVFDPSFVLMHNIPIIIVAGFVEHLK